jgi:4-hydroxy-3-polyprenylbenzoate decarboxylase
VRGVKRVVMHEPLTNLRPVIFVQYAAGTARTEVWRGLQGAATLTPNCGKICIAVSEDIDPANTDAIFWSLAYRSNPIEDVHVVPYRGGVQGSQYRERGADSTLLIDATAKGPMPPLALPKQEFMQRAQALWAELGLPPITLKSPWHGYTLGDWIERWDVWAARAVKGEWEETGRETLARQRGGMKPESSARKTEG